MLNRTLTLSALTSVALAGAPGFTMQAANAMNRL